MPERLNRASLEGFPIETFPEGIPIWEGNDRCGLALMSNIRR